jgi:hypothetical protein
MKNYFTNLPPFWSKRKFTLIDLLIAYKWLLNWLIQRYCKKRAGLPFNFGLKMALYVDSILDCRVHRGT